MGLEQWIGMAAALIISTVKNPQHAAQLRGVMAKIVKTIMAAYQGDGEFQKLISTP